MADLTVTPANVAPLETVREVSPLDGIAGEAIDAGEFCYQDKSDSNKIKLVAAGTAVTFGYQFGIALNTAEAANQPIRIALPGSQVTLASSALGALGDVYYGSTNGGKFAPWADLTTGNNVFLAIIFVSTTAVEVLGFNVNGTKA